MYVWFHTWKIISSVNFHQADRLPLPEKCKEWPICGFPKAELKYQLAPPICSSMYNGGVSDSVLMLAHPIVGLIILTLRPFTSEATTILPWGSFVTNLESNSSPSLIVAPLYPITLYCKIQTNINIGTWKFRFCLVFDANLSSYRMLWIIIVCCFCAIS